jgi:hypothetical protein
MLQYYEAMTGKEKLPRAERRRLMKEQKISKEEAKNLYRPTMTVHDYLHYYDLAIVDALYCSLNLENDKIKEVFDKIKMTVDCLATGHISCIDLEHMVEEEVGIKFKRR